jgi:hypothetical protein
LNLAGTSALPAPGSATGASPSWAARDHAFRIVGEADIVALAARTFTDLPAADAVDVHQYVVQRTDDGYTILGTNPPERVATVPAVLEMIQWLVNQHVIDGLTETETGVHAACAQRGAEILLIPAPSGSGKSTTVAGLVRAGWDYLTDETAVLDNETLTVTPYSKPISIDHGAWPLFPEIEGLPRSEDSCLVPVARLGGSVGFGGRVTAVVCPTFSDGREVRLEPMSPAEVVMALATSTFAFSSAGQRHLPVLARLARSAPGYRLVTGDLQGTLDAIGTITGGPR